MHNPANPDAPMSAGSQNDIILSHLTANKGQWVAMTDLAKQAECFAVHSRVADIRRMAGVTIENCCKTVQGKRHSFYRLLEADVVPA